LVIKTVRLFGLKVHQFLAHVYRIAVIYLTAFVNEYIAEDKSCKSPPHQLTFQ